MKSPPTDARFSSVAVPAVPAGDNPSDFTIGRSALLVGLCYLVTVLLGILLSHGVFNRSFFETAAAKGDNQEYLQLARSALNHRLDDPALARSKRLYLWTPLAAALVSRITRLDPVYTLPLTCWIAAALSWYLACLLYGPATGALVLCIDFSVMERFIYGGPEAPALLLCLTGALAREKREQSGTPRGLGFVSHGRHRPAICNLLSDRALVRSSRPARLRKTRVISRAGGGCVRGVPLLFIHRARVASDPITGYSEDWYGNSPVSFPLWPIIVTISRGTETSGALAKELVYALLILAAVFLLAGNYRAVAAKLPLDCLAFSLSAWFLFSYNAPYVLSEFPRLAVLCIPFACYLIWQFLAARYRVPRWSVFAICLAVAIFSALSTHNVSDSAKYLMRLTHGT